MLSTRPQISARKRYNAVMDTKITSVTLPYELWTEAMEHGLRQRKRFNQIMLEALRAWVDGQVLAMAKQARKAE